jgi:hypothetical protein
MKREKKVPSQSTLFSTFIGLDFGGSFKEKRKAKAGKA